VGLLIDSSIFIAAERAQQPPGALLEQFGDQPVALSAITASELFHGAHRADGALRRGRREQFVGMVLQAVPILPFDLAVAQIHARLWADFQRRGERIGAHDLMIAATALAHDLTVATQNKRHFEKVEGLGLAVW
jgi:tRNA(fMet)-specific endonuclease VapC